MEWYLVLAVIGIGFLAGFINTLAGSGSLLTLPLLIFLGLPANIANGTNRIAILLQNIVATGSFKKQNVLNTKKGLKLAVPASAGSLIGAYFAVEINEAIIKQLIAGLLILMFFLILLKPTNWIKGKVQTENERSKISIKEIVSFFFIGIYGGFIQAGVGLFLLAGLVLSAGFDLVKANAVKVLIVMIYTIFAFAVFACNGQVDYKIGLILAVGNMGGAFTASKFAVIRGANFVRYVLLFVLLASSAKIFYDVLI